MCLFAGLGRPREEKAGVERRRSRSSFGRSRGWTFRAHVFFIRLGGTAHHALSQKRIQEDVRGDGLPEGTCLGSYFGKGMA